MKRSIAIGAALAAGVLYATIMHAADAPATSCGMGAPPGSAAFKAEQAASAERYKQYGYEQVCEDRLKRFQLDLLPVAVGTADLAFVPVSLAGTPFDRFLPLGALPDGVNEIRSQVYRGFRTPTGHTVILHEHDMSADGSNAWRDPADEPERIDGMPARLVVLQAPSGKAVSDLSWFEGRRGYQLWIDANVAKADAGPLRDQLFALAASLPKSTPACPNEIPPESAAPGPDGMPVRHVPANLTIQLDSQGRIIEPPRPCK